MANFTATSSFNILDAGFTNWTPDEPLSYVRAATVAGVKTSASFSWDTANGNSIVIGGKFSGRQIDKGEVRVIAQFDDDGGQLWTLTGTRLKSAVVTAAMDEGGVAGANVLAAALSGDDNITLSDEDDVMYGFDGKDKMYGNAGDDRIYGGAGADTLYGGSGNDELQGGDGNDLLRGDADRDVIFGGAGRDKIYGGAGADMLFGGSDNERDTFVFESAADCGDASGADTIRDFVSGVDRIDLFAIDANVLRAGNQAFRFIGARDFSGKPGELRFADGVVYGDVNGDGQADFSINLPDLQSMSAKDFAL